MVREQAGTALGRQGCSIIAAGQAYNTGSACISFGKAEGKLVGFSSSREKDRLTQISRRHLRQFVTSLQHRRRQKLSACMQQLLGLACDSLNELGMVVPENAAEHPGSQIQELFPIRVAKRTAPAIDQNLVTVRHGHQDVIAVLT